eukprot:2149799-Rhodomonas_salina.5
MRDATCRLTTRDPAQPVTRSAFSLSRPRPDAPFAVVGVWISMLHGPVSNAARWRCGDHVQREIQETGFLVQIVLKMRFLFFDFGVDARENDWEASLSLVASTEHFIAGERAPSHSSRRANDFPVYTPKSRMWFLVFDFGVYEPLEDQGAQGCAATRRISESPNWRSGAGTAALCMCSDAVSQTAAQVLQPFSPRSHLPSQKPLLSLHHVTPLPLPPSPLENAPVRKP